MSNINTQFKKGMIPWNKGKKRPDISGEKHPNWKGKVQIECKVCSKSFAVSYYRGSTASYCSRRCMHQDHEMHDKIGFKNSLNLRGRRISPATEFKKGCVSINKGKNCPWAKNNPQTFTKGFRPWNTGIKVPQTSGEKHHNWKGGITPENLKIRASLEYQLWRTAVFTRDDFTCQECGDDKGGNLHAHHIKPFAYFPELRLVIDNGVTLCRECHKKTDSYLKKINLKVDQLTN